MPSDTTHPAPGPDLELTRSLTALAAAFSGQVGVFAHDLLTDRTVAIAADEPFETASTIKVLILIAAFQAARDGRLSLDEPLTLEERHLVRGSGVLCDLTPGLQLSVRDTLTLMVTVSDNVATNMAIDRVGMDAIAACARSFGLKNTRLFGPLHFDREPAEGVGVSTPRELALLMERIATGRAVGPAEDAAMLHILDRNQYTTGLTRTLPYDLLEEPSPNVPPRIQVASKSGTWDGVRNIVGYVRGEDTSYVVCLMSRGCKDARFHVDNEAMLLLPRLSRVIFDAFAHLPGEDRTAAAAARGDRA